MSRTRINTGRAGFVWVRLLDNPNELVKAHNSKVAAEFGMPVIIEWDGHKYEVVDRDVDRYNLWGSQSAFLPAHAAQHSAMRDAEGADILWVDSRQFLPMLVMPNGITGSKSVAISDYAYRNSAGIWGMVGGTGTFDLPGISATGSNLYLLMIDDDTFGFYAITGSVFAFGITGTGEILPYVPAVPNTADMPAAIIRTSQNEPILWNHLYEARQFFSNGGGSASTGTSGGGITSLYGDVVASGTGAALATIQPGSVENSMLADMTGPTIKGRASGTGPPQDLTLSQLGALGSFSGVSEDISSQVTGTGITHFTISAPAYLIWVMVDGVKQKDADVTFVTNASAFDLSWSPSTGVNLEVIKLSPVASSIPINDYILVRDEKTAGTNGGSFTAGAWQTREINKEVSDVGGHCSLPGSNVIRLVAGTYRYKISSPVYAVDRHQVRLYDVTGGAAMTDGEGMSMYADSALRGANRSEVVGQFTISSQNDFRVEQRCETTSNTYGLGVANNFGGKEIYTIAEFWKVG